MDPCIVLYLARVVILECMHKIVINKFAQAHCFNANGAHNKNLALRSAKTPTFFLPSSILSFRLKKTDKKCLYLAGVYMYTEK